MIDASRAFISGKWREVRKSGVGMSMGPGLDGEPNSPPRQGWGQEIFSGVRAGPRPEKKFLVRVGPSTGDYPPHPARALK